MKVTLVLVHAIFTIAHTLPLEGLSQRPEGHELHQKQETRPEDAKLYTESQDVASQVPESCKELMNHTSDTTQVQETVTQGKLYYN